MVATCLSISPLTSLALSSRYLITFNVAEFIPALISLSLKPSIFWASFIIEWASMVAVVVPSPASSTVFLAACFNSVAPMFSIGSISVTALATVTPSFVTTGFPEPSSRSTHLPLAPRVELTARYSLSIPLNTFSLASLPKLRCLIISFDIT